MPSNDERQETQLLEKQNTLKEIEYSFSKVFFILDLQCYQTEEVKAAKDLISSLKNTFQLTTSKNYILEPGLSQAVGDEAPQN